VPAPAPPAPPWPPQFEGKRLIVFYFDLDGTPAEWQAHATSASAEFVRSQMQPNDLVAIMTASPGTKVVQDFTSDHDRLIAALGELSFDSNSDAGGPDGLLTVTKMLSALREKKSLVYFTTPAFRQSLSQDQIQSLIDLGKSANVAFYPIDVSTLLGAGRK
jgi:VWFA-related protein